MPGAWELAGPSVMVATLTREQVAMRWAMAAARGLQIPAGGNWFTYTGMPFDHARNSACEGALAGGFRHIFFLDDDVVPPSDVIQRLLARNLDIVSGLYFLRSPPICPVMMRRVEGQGGQWITEFAPGQLVEADYVGAGCLLIRTDVFRKMRPPWFEWLTDRMDLPPHERLSEDYAFLWKARRDHGYKVFVDTGVQCEHIGLAKSSIEGYKPCVL